MNKQGNKKITLNDFLAKKLKKDEDKDKTLDITISSMDGKTITVKKPNDEEIFDYMDRIGDENNIKVAIQETMKFVYRKCPDLQNQELHEALEIKDPYDVIDALFDIKDKQEIMEQFSTFMGFKPESIDEEIKNS